ncbi:type VI secretion protein [Streptomyces sp. CRN 30]|uniref:type VI secretion protein n=1 Tax=Streptomyces sp. CRN 30 TaxID=3075613 RepID=UPI002A8084E1|nr:type VI secretion protein [Streptomyces sp. CRN 30]
MSGTRPEENDQRGIPDGLLLGFIGFLIGMTVLVWTATGLAALFTHGSWPDGIAFTRTPMAVRHLIGRPDDLAGAWPEASADQLSGYGLFWGLLIGQVMVLVVLTVFVVGTVARWRAVRAREKAERAAAVRGPAAPQAQPQAQAQAQAEPQPQPQPRPQQEQQQQPQPGLLSKPAPDPAPGLAAEPTPTPPPATTATVTTAAAVVPLPSPEAAVSAGVGAVPAVDPLLPLPGPRVPVVLGSPETRHPVAAEALRDAAGPALVVTSSPTLWEDTKDARAKLGPVLLYDPSHLCDTPARLHWSPSRGCEDKATAAARAAALLAPVRPTAKLDQALADVAETLLRCYLHAAAVDGRAFRHVHRWAQGNQVQDAVRILRTSPKAAPGTAGELESALTSHPERRDMAQELTARALSALFTVNVRNACTPHRTDSLALDSFINEGGTLYVVGEPIEDPRATPGAMPLLTALTASVVERGRTMAERSSAGRLDPPFTLVLDDVAAVAPLPQLPELLTSGADLGLPTLALMRSREQGRSRWPQYELPVQ